MRSIVTFIIYHTLLMALCILIIRDTYSVWTGLAVLLYGMWFRAVANEVRLIKAIVWQLHLERKGQVHDHR